MILASVPELQNLICSMEGKRPHSNARQLSFVRGRRTHGDTCVQGLVYRRLDDLVRMTEQARRILADEIDVAMTVQVRELRALP